MRPLEQLSESFDHLRVPVKGQARRRGPYPYYGASGIVDRVDAYLFDGDYLLVAEDGENLRTRQTPIAFMATGRFWVNNHAHVLKANTDNDTRFLMYALRATDVSGYLTGSTMPKLTKSNLGRILVPAPSLAIQRAIAHILGTLDDKIELNRRTNETLEAMARALFKSWFVDFDPVHAKAAGREPDGMDAETAALFPSEFAESELGPIPREWQLQAIGDLAAVVGGSTPSTKVDEYWVDGRHYWATPKDLSGLVTPVLLRTERLITDAGLAQIGSGLLPIGTVLLSSRAPIGYRAITEVPVAINQGFIAMLPSAGVSRLFLLLWSSFAHDAILGRANGSTFLEISKSNFRPIPLVAPTPTVMSAFDRAVSPLYNRVVSNEKETASLVRIRDALLPRLLSGQLSVPTAAHIASAAT